ncbi:hypothetical protein R6Q57_004488 [Mikania cordata]
MGCFLGCFGSSNDKKRKQQRYKIIPRAQKPKIKDILKVDASLEQIFKERPSNQFQESRENSEVPLILKRPKKVTFDTNVTTYEHIQVYDSTESLLERNEKGETFPKSQPDPNSKEDSVVSSMSGYRYGNCVESDDEIDDLDQEDYDFDDDDDDLDVDDEEHYVDDHDHVEDSISSMELNRNARCRNGYVPSVLNPVENLFQWKELKFKGSTRKLLNFNGQKENLNSPEPDDQNQETGVDTSLSNWLISSEKITRNNKRIASYNPEFDITATSKF